MELQWTSDGELFDLMRWHLFPAVVGDIMDTMDLPHQFLPPAIQPIDSSMKVVGRAMTVLTEDVGPAEAENGRHPPFGLMMKALDSLEPHEVYLCSGGSPTYALWGELMSYRARHLRAAGAVLNGYHRDTQGILDLAFPTFSFGGYAQDQGVRGRVVDFRSPMAIGQVEIQAGDILFGDRDGVCVIPRRAEREVLHAAWIKAQGENTVRNAIMHGMGAEEAFQTYGIL